MNQLLMRRGAPQWMTQFKKRSAKMCASRWATTTKSVTSEEKKVAIPFRMPDLFEGSNVQLNEWYVKVGSEIKKDQNMCQLETPEVLLNLSSEDTGYVAQLSIPEGTKGIESGTTLAVIVPSLDDVEKFNPEVTAEEHQTDNVINGTDVLRLLKSLFEESDGLTEQEYKRLKSFARNQHLGLITTFEASFPGDEFDASTFDKAFFMENVREILAEESEAK